MSINLKISILAAFYILPFWSFGQNLSTIDSFNLIITQAIEFQKEDSHEKANKLLTDVLNWENKSHIADSTLGLAYHKLGVSRYYLLEDQKAIEAWSKALSIRLKLLSKTHKDLIKGYRNIGNAYVNLGQFGLAQENMEIALQLNLKRTISDSLLLTEIYRELGYILTQQNDFAKAEIYLNTAADLSPTIFKDTPWEVAHTYNLLVLLYLEQKQPKKMIDFALKGVAIYEIMNDKYEEDYWNIADFYNNIGLAYEQMLDYSKAILFYQKSIKINKRFPENRLTAQAETHNNLAVLYDIIGDWKRALLNIDKAITLDKQQGNLKGLAANYNTKGELYLKRKDYKTALEYYQQGIDYLITDYTSDSLNQIPSVQQSIIGNKPQLIQHLFDKVRAYQEYAKQENAKKNLSLGLQNIDSINVLINQIRTGFESDASKEFLTSQAKIIFEKAIKTCFQLAFLTNKKETYFQKAFAYAEQSKSIILLEAVKESGAKVIAGIPTTLLEREQKLKEQIANTEASLFTTTNQSEKSQLRADLLSQQQHLEMLIDTFNRFYPTYHQLKYDFPTIDVLAYQTQLSPEEGLLEYFVGNDQTYWFYLDNVQIQMDTLPANLPLNQWIVDFRNSIVHSFTKRETAKDSLDKVYNDLGYQLYQTLLFPILKSVNIEKLRLIPDGVLGYLPFAALLTKSVDTQQLGTYKNYPFLLNDYQISYSYSMSLLEEMKSHQQKADKKELLAFAPTFEADKPLVLGKTIIDLPPLLANVITTQKLIKTYTGKAYLNETAQKTQFLNQAPNYAYIHLASHAQMNDENADYSFISFSQIGDSVKQEELLFVKELYNVPLKAEMVVLSACETALGELKEGEGIISLARAFAYAGAQSVITTLWQISDQRSAELITTFYQFLEKGATKDMALWQAQKTLIEQGFNAHPYYWSGFIPIGDMRPIQLGKSRPFSYLIFGLPFLLLGAGLLYFFRKKRSE